VIPAVHPAEYLSESASWDADRRALECRSRRTAWIIASIAVFTTCMAIAALLLMVPLKRVEPYVIRVDNTTGVIDIVPPYVGNSTPADAVTRYLLTHYVSTCERFSIAIAEEDYTECGAFHSPQRNQQWAAQWATGNPESPLNRFKDGTTVRVNVQSVSFFERATGRTDLAQVRFVKATRAGGTGPDLLTHWIATIHYAYGKPPSDIRSRQWNPLGFRILDMQIEPELIESSAAIVTLGPRP
jgi:type IV secretion system protein VirB8